MRRKIAVFLTLGILSSCLLTGCKDESTAQNKLKYDSSANMSSVTSGVVAENSNYNIVWDDGEKRVAFTDLRNNTVWSLCPADTAEPELDEFGLPIKANPAVSSALSIKYVDSDQHEITTYSKSGSVNNGTVSAETIENGIKVTYYFPDVEISVPVEYFITDDAFKITVKTSEIAESDNKITEVSVAPFLCSVSNDGSGYLFIPSGSGALVYPKTVSAEGDSYRQEIYGDDEMVLVYDKVSEEEEIKMPVFGAKNGDSAVCAIIESGAESSFIDATCGSSNYKYSSVYPSLRVRGYDYYRAQTYRGNYIETDYYRDDLTDTVFTVSYTPLYNEEADYNGMADVYRNYLQKNYGLSENGATDNTFALTVLGGYMDKKSFLGVPYKTLKTLTTVEQTLDIVKDISTAAEVKPVLYLEGFGESGLDIGEYGGGYTLNGKIGSVKQLNSLAEYCAESGVTAYFNFDMLRYSESGNGLSKMFSSAKNAVGNKYYPSGYNVALRDKSTDYALIKKSLLTKHFDKLISKTKNWKIQGFAFDTLGYMTYSDYSETDYYNKKNTQLLVKENLTAVKESGKNVSVCNANDYAAVLADHIFDTPLTSSKSDIFDEDVPFYQMVFKGYVPTYSSAINLSAEPDELLLAAIECGCYPMWSVMKDYDNSAINISSQQAHNGVYDVWKSKISAAVNETADYYKSISSATISKHELLENGVRKTTYSNGVFVLVNRGNTEQSTELGTLQAGEYKIGGIN